MTDTNQSALSPTWTLMLLIVIVLIAINASLARQKSLLRAELMAVEKRVVDADKVIAQETVNTIRFQELRTAVLQNSRTPFRRGDVGLGEMLKACSSREEFVVREGPKFAWSLLNSSTEHVKKIGLYAPPGQHVFKYAVRWPDDGSEQGKFTYGDARAIRGAIGVELTGASRVYQINLDHDQHGTIELSLLGDNNEVLHQNTLPVINAPCRLGLNMRHESPAYPAELKLSFRAKSFFEERKSAPVTEIGWMFIQQDRPQLPRQLAHLRMWVESDVRACITATNVIRSFPEVTQLRDHGYKKPNLTLKDYQL